MRKNLIRAIQKAVRTRYFLFHNGTSRLPYYMFRCGWPYCVYRLHLQYKIKYEFHCFVFISSVIGGYTWWRHRMETFSALLVLCVGNSPVTGEFPTQRPVARSFGVFFDLRLNKRLSKQSRGRWLETPSRSLWHDCNVCGVDVHIPCWLMCPQSSWFLYSHYGSLKIIAFSVKQSWGKWVKTNISLQNHTP